MKVSVAIALILVLFPVSVCLFVALGKSLLVRLALWISLGYLMSQWMQVMIFVFRSIVEKSTTPAEVNMYYFIHIKWWVALILGITFSVLQAIILIRMSSFAQHINITHVFAVLLAALVLSQAAGSSIPKFAGELSLAALFLLGVIALRFFLTYPIGTEVPAYQRQSDALTSFGLLIGLVSIMGPFIIIMADLIWKYFVNEGLILQFQITRYAAMVAWILLGIGLIGFECLKALIKARGYVT